MNSFNIDPQLIQLLAITGSFIGSAVLMGYFGERTAKRALAGTGNEWYHRAARSWHVWTALTVFSALFVVGVALVGFFLTAFALIVPLTFVAAGNSEIESGLKRRPA